ncbi:MAG: hypothetical protein JJU00_13055 [Opitutales bacterium]|nr:hypothetical protein [Opitutales bacterium]
MHEPIRITGTVTLRLLRAGRPAAQVLRMRNLVTGAARDALAATLTGVPFGAALSHIHLGTGTAPAALGDTAPDTAGPHIRKALRRLWMPAAYIVQADWSLDAGDLTGEDLTEFALLRDLGDGSDALFSRVTRPPIHVTPDLGIDGTWVLTFSP